MRVISKSFFLPVVSFLTLLLLVLLPQINSGKLGVPPGVGDGPDYDNIGWNIAEGKGFGYDWSDKQWRKPYEEFRDQTTYSSLLKREDGFSPTAYRPPLVPFLLSLLYRMFGHRFAPWRIVDAVLLAFSLMLVVSLANRRFGKEAAYLALFLAVADIGIGIRSYPSYGTEGVSMFLVALALVFGDSYQRSNKSSLAFTLGCVFALLILTRSIFLLCFPVLFLSFFFLKQVSLKRKTKHALSFGLTALLVVAPWIIRNISLFDEFFPFGTQGLSNLPVAYSEESLANGGLWLSSIRDKVYANLGDFPSSFQREKARANMGRKLTRDWIERHGPLLVPKLLVTRIVSLWWTHAYELQKLLFLLCLVFLVFYWKHSSTRISFIFLLAYTLSVAATWVVYGGRFLIPLHPLLYLAGGVSLGGVVRWAWFSPLPASRLSAYVAVLAVALNVVGPLVPPQRVDPNSKYELPGYSHSDISPKDAKQRLVEISRSKGREQLLLLADTIFRSYVHKTSGPYYRKPWDNWYLYFRGFFNSRFRQSQDGDFLWSRGAGFCDQAAIIFADYADRYGYDVRLDWLTGHVVTEVLIPDVGWRVFDVDHGIYWDTSLREFARNVSQEGFINEFVRRGYSQTHARNMADVYFSAEDNQRSFYPFLPRLYKQERLGFLVAWGIPILFIFLSIVLFVRYRNLRKMSSVLGE